MARHDLETPDSGKTWLALDSEGLETHPETFEDREEDCEAADAQNPQDGACCSGKVEDVPTFQQARKLAAAKLADAQFVAAVSKDVRRHRLGHYDEISKG